MASTFTDVAQIEKPGIGEQENAWGDTVNANFDLIDKALFQAVDIDMTGGSDVTPALSVWVNPVLTLSGTITGNIGLILPAEEKWWFIKNGTSGAFSITAKVTGQTGVTLTQGEWAIIRGDGSDIEKITLGIGGGGTGVTTLAALLAALGIPLSAVTAKTGAYTVLTSDKGDLLTGDASGGAFSFTLPALADLDAGTVYAFIKIDNSANAVTLDGDSAETINGATTLALSSQFDWAILIPGASEWHALTVQDLTALANTWAAAQTFSGEVTFGDQIMLKIGTTEASAATLALDGDGNIYSVSGTDTITAVTGVKEGGLYVLIATGAWTITDDGDNIIMDPVAGGGTYTMGVGQVSIWYAHADNKITFAGGHPFFAGQSTMIAGTNTLVGVSPGRMKYHHGVAKAWVAWDASSGTPTIQDSHGVTSLTDSGTGDVTINLAITMANDNYVAVGMNQAGTGSTGTSVSRKDGGTWSTTAAQVLTKAGSPADTSYAAVAIFGEQA